MWISKTDFRVNFSLLNRIMRYSDALDTPIDELCRDIAPDAGIITPEIHMPNDFYGGAEQLKRYVGFPSYYPLKVAMQHGAYFDSNYYWEYDINNRMQLLFPWGEHVASIWRRHTDKRIEPIGAPFFYAQPLISKEETEAERARLGKNLLLFPPHSSRALQINYDIVRWLDQIKEYTRQFDTIRVCVFWKNILDGEHLRYQDAGYECVSAGHTSDIFFLPRLRSLLDVCDATLGHQLGSHIGYSVYLGKPHVLCKAPVEEICLMQPESDRKAYLEASQNRNQDPGWNTLESLFSQDTFRITQDQKDTIGLYHGFEFIRSAHELRSLLLQAEDLYMQKYVSPTPKR